MALVPFLQPRHKLSKSLNALVLPNLTALALSGAKGRLLEMVTSCPDENPAVPTLK